MKILVTGGAGFIGGHLSRRHAKKGDEVTVVDNMRTGDIKNIPKNVDFVNLDVGSDSIESIFAKKYDLIYHFSGQSSVEVSYSDPIYDLDSNCRSTLRLLQLCDKYCPGSHFYTRVRCQYMETLVDLLLKKILIEKVQIFTQLGKELAKTI